jgi:hypothetical protein
MVVKIVIVYKSQIYLNMIVHLNILEMAVSS